MTESIYIEKIKFGAMVRLGSDFCDVDVYEHVDYITGDLTLAMRACVFGEKGSTVKIEHPADWLQALKQRFAPEWFVRRWPVLMTVHHITPQTIYKNLKISLPRETHHIRMNVEPNYRVEG